MTKDEAQRRRWTFYEAVRFGISVGEKEKDSHLQAKAMSFLPRLAVGPHLPSLGDCLVTRGILWQTR